MFYMFLHMQYLLCAVIRVEVEVVTHFGQAFAPIMPFQLSTGCLLCGNCYIIMIVIIIIMMVYFYVQFFPEST